MSAPLVSIVIPVYNGANYLAEAIDSALAQTYKNIEILVLNDGSNDSGKTEEVALSYGDKIKYFNKENGGVATALNLGIEKMSGQYFSWLSHDDIYYPNKIENQVREMSNQADNTVLFSNVKIIDSDSNFVMNHNVSKFKYDYQMLNLLCNQEINGCSLLIPKSLFDKVGTFDVDLKTTQDYDMWIRLSSIAKFVYQDIYSVGSRRHSAQESWAPHHVEGVDKYFSKIINSIDLVKFKQMNSEVADEFILSMTKNFTQKRKNSRILHSITSFVNEAIDESNRLGSLKLNIKYISTREKFLSMFKHIVPISLKLEIKKRLGRS